MAIHKTLTVASLDDILNVVQRARGIIDAQPDEECFFRGHGDLRHELLPTLQRKAAERRWSDEEMLTKEDALFWEFQARAYELHHLPLDDWDYLFAMRHHGVPTRLLDWTESFAVALYFAVCFHDRHRRTDPCVWVLNPYALNEQAGGIRDLMAPRHLGWDDEDKIAHTYGQLIADRAINWEQPFAIYPMQRVARMRAQRGWFTIHGSDRRPIEKIAPNCVVRIDFDGTSIQDTRDLLNLLGFDSFAIFADLDSLAESVTSKNIGPTNVPQRRIRHKR
jgi:FRG domain